MLEEPVSCVCFHLLKVQLQSICRCACKKTWYVTLNVDIHIPYIQPTKLGVNQDYFRDDKEIVYWYQLSLLKLETENNEIILYIHTAVHSTRFNGVGWDQALRNLWQTIDCNCHSLGADAVSQQYCSSFYCAITLPTHLKQYLASPMSAMRFATAYIDFNTREHFVLHREL